ncbi:MAG: hypothetical protein ACREIQ_01390 [Nitrospiria bacterium]
MSETRVEYNAGQVEEKPEIVHRIMIDGDELIITAKGLHAIRLYYQYLMADLNQLWEQEELTYDKSGDELSMYSSIWKRMSVDQ